MARTLRAKYPRDLYLPELTELVEYGEPVEVRGRQTLEILNVISEVEEPWHHCILLPSRHWNPWLAMSEALWILAGRNDIAALAPYNKNIANYSDDGKTLYGAYGARIYEQIDELIERLRKDPSDRRAVLQIWDSGLTASIMDGRSGYYDLWTDSKDPPCNNMVYFKLRENKLHMTVICRSNDLHWGLFAVNLPTFGILQVYIAARLGVEVGTQTHLSNSLHIYTDDKAAVDITDRMMYGKEEPLPIYPVHGLVFEELTWIKSHDEFAKEINIVLDELIKSDDQGFRYDVHMPGFLAFAVKFLWAYQTRKFEPEWFFNTWPQFADWTLAGKIFAEKVWKQPANVT